ncbi:MAG TPA: hypothetical protein VFF27_10640, partial [Bacteroidia bacterium]|nr:hypothetical protein [Bacteroidia bacterium]
MKAKLLIILFFSAIQIYAKAEDPKIVGGEATAYPASVCSGQHAVIRLKDYKGTTIRWQRDSAGTFVFIYPLVQTDSLVTPALTVESKYRALVSTLDLLLFDSSTVATVSITPFSVGGTIKSTSYTVCAGESVTVSLNNDHVGNKIQWQLDSTNLGFVNISGAESASYTSPPLTKSTIFRAAITNSPCGPDNTNTASITVTPASKGGTAKTVSNINNTVCKGSTVDLTVTGYVGTDFKWLVDSTGSSYQEIAGATGHNYTTMPITKTMRFKVRVQNANCTEDFSSVVEIYAATTSVGGETSPDTAICKGGVAKITLKGYQGSIQWQIDSTGSFVDIPGAHGTPYNATGLTKTSKFKAIVTSAGCNPDPSTITVVTVNPVPNPGSVVADNATICFNTGTNINLNGATAGATIQWQKNPPTGFADIANATTTPYSTGNLTVDTKFRAVVSLGACSAISNVATVSITSLPSPGTAKADDTTVCNGTGTHVKLTNAASGVQITWQSKTSGAFADIANSNTADYVTGNLTTTTSYRAFVKKNNCTDTSNIVTVVVKPVPSGGSAVTAADSICSGSSTVINLNGATNGATIQWEKKTASTYDPIPGANTAPYNTGSLTTTTWFHAKISVGSCSVYSGETRVLIKAKPVGGTISPGNTLLCTGKSLSLKLNNSSGQIQWQKNDSGTFEDLVGEIDDTYQTPNLSKTTKYRAILKNATCPNDTSKVITITISPLSKGGDAYATPASICNNLKSVVRVQNFVGSSIQWQKKLSNGSFQNVSGLTDSIFTTPALTTTTTYQAVVTSGACASATSLPVTINVSPAADGGDAVADSTNVCYNTGTAIRLQNYSGASIQWQSDESAPGNFSDIAGAHSNVYLATNLKKTTSFKAIVKNDTCPSSESTIATVTVIPKTLAGTLSANPKKVCSGSTAKLTLASYTPGAQIKWMKNIGNNNFQVIPGATGNEYTTINLTEDTEYKAIVRYGHCDSAFSNAVTVQITTQDGGDALASPGTICSGTSSTLSLTGQTGSYKWQQYDGSNFVDIPGAKHDTAYKIPSLIATTIFRAYVSGGSCPDVTSNEVTVTVTPPSKGGKAKPDKNKYSVCSGTNTSISLTQYDGTIDWQVDNSGTGTGPFLDVNPISHLTKYTTPNLTQKTRYRAKVTRSGCAPAYSDTVTISIDPASVAGTLEYSSSTICSGGTVTFSVKDYAGTIQWQCDTSNSFQNISATGTPYTTFPITKNTTFRALVTNGSCSSVYVDAPITVAPALSGGKAVATTSTICSGSQTTIHLRNYTGQIQWQTNNGTTNFQDIPNAHDSLYTTPALTIETKYRAILSSGTCPTATSEEATVSILSASKGGKATANPSTICSNTTTTITLSQYVGAIQWQVDSTNVFKDIAGQNAPTLTTPRLTKNTSFRAVVTSNGCDPDNSTTAFVSVTPASYGGVATPVQSSVCSGGTATINLTKEIGTLIQWQKDSLGWVDIPNATGKSLSIVLTQTTRFRARVRNGTCNMANSNVVEITITPTLKGGTAKATPSSICSGTTTTIKLTGNTGSLIQWQMNKGNGYVDMANQTDSILVTPQLFYPASTSFRAHVNGSGCPQVTSTVATVTTIPLSVAGTVSATPSKICSGDNSVLKLTGNTGTIQWQSDEGGNGFIDIPGQTNATYTTPALNTSTSYKAVVTSGSCPSEKTAAALVTVVPSSLSGFAKATPATVCNGGTSKLSV